MLLQLQSLIMQKFHMLYKLYLNLPVIYLFLTRLFFLSLLKKKNSMLDDISFLMNIVIDVSHDDSFFFLVE